MITHWPQNSCGLRFEFNEIHQVLTSLCRSVGLAEKDTILRHYAITYSLQYIGILMQLIETVDQRLG